MARFSRLILFTLVMTAAILAVQAQTQEAIALRCDCSGTVDAFQYPDTWVASQSFGFTNGWEPSQSLCQDVCWSDAVNTAASLCNSYGLHGGVGFVWIDWHFTYDLFTTGGNSSQYDCDAF
jgi:hypothetical protein